MYEDDGLSKEARALFYYLLGLPYPAMSPKYLRDLAGQHRVAAGGFRRLIVAVIEVGRAAMDQFRGGRTREALGKKSAVLQEALDDLAQGYDANAESLLKTALNVEYARYMVEGMLAWFVLELTMAIVTLRFELVPEIFAITRAGLTRILVTLLKHVATSMTLEVGVAGALDRIIQQLQRSKGYRTGFDHEATHSALVGGALGGTLGVPAGLAAEHIAKLLASHLGAGVRTTLEQRLRDLGAGSDLATGLANDIGTVLSRDAHDLLAALSTPTDRPPLPAPGPARTAPGPDRFGEAFAHVFATHLSKTGSADERAALRQSGQAYGQALFHALPPHKSRSTADALARVGDGPATAVVPDAVRTALDELPGIIGQQAARSVQWLRNGATLLSGGVLEGAGESISDVLSNLALTGQAGTDPFTFVGALFNGIAHPALTHTADKALHAVDHLTHTSTTQSIPTPTLPTPPAPTGPVTIQKPAAAGTENDGSDTASGDGSDADTVMGDRDSTWGEDDITVVGDDGAQTWAAHEDKQDGHDDHMVKTHPPAAHSIDAKVRPGISHVQSDGKPGTGETVGRPAPLPVGVQVFRADTDGAFEDGLGNVLGGILRSGTPADLDRFARALTDRGPGPEPAAPTAQASGYGVTAAEHTALPGTTPATSSTAGTTSGHAGTGTNSGRQAAVGHTATTLPDTAKTTPTTPSGLAGGADRPTPTTPGPISAADRADAREAEGSRQSSQSPYEASAHRVPEPSLPRGEARTESRRGEEPAQTSDGHSKAPEQTVPAAARTAGVSSEETSVEREPGEQRQHDNTDGTSPGHSAWMVSSDGPGVDEAGKGNFDTPRSKTSTQAPQNPGRGPFVGMAIIQNKTTDTLNQEILRNKLDRTTPGSPEYLRVLATLRSYEQKTTDGTATADTSVETTPVSDSRPYDTIPQAQQETAADTDAFSPTGDEVAAYGAVDPVGGSDRVARSGGFRAGQGNQPGGLPESAAASFSRDGTADSAQAAADAGEGPASSSHEQRDRLRERLDPASGPLRLSGAAEGENLPTATEDGVSSAVSRSEVLRGWAQMDEHLGSEIRRALRDLLPGGQERPVFAADDIREAVREAIEGPGSRNVRSIAQQAAQYLLNGTRARLRGGTSADTAAEPSGGSSSRRASNVSRRSDLQRTLPEPKPSHALYPVVNSGKLSQWAGEFNRARTAFDALADDATRESIWRQALQVMQGRHQPPTVDHRAAPGTNEGDYLSLHKSMTTLIAVAINTARIKGIHTDPRDDSHPAKKLSERLRTAFRTQATHGMPGGAPRRNDTRDPSNGEGSSNRRNATAAERSTETTGALASRAKGTKLATSPARVDELLPKMAEVFREKYLNGGWLGKVKHEAIVDIDINGKVEKFKFGRLLYERRKDTHISDYALARLVWTHGWDFSGVSKLAERVNVLEKLAKDPRSLLERALENDLDPEILHKSERKVLQLADQYVQDMAHGSAATAGSTHIPNEQRDAGSGQRPIGEITVLKGKSLYDSLFQLAERGNISDHLLYELVYNRRWTIPSTLSELISRARRLRQLSEDRSLLTEPDSIDESRASREAVAFQARRHTQLEQPAPNVGRVTAHPSLGDLLTHALEKRLDRSLLPEEEREQLDLIDFYLASKGLSKLGEIRYSGLNLSGRDVESEATKEEKALFLLRDIRYANRSMSDHMIVELVRNRDWKNAPSRFFRRLEEIDQSIGNGSRLARPYMADAANPGQGNDRIGDLIGSRRSVGERSIAPLERVEWRRAVMHLYAQAYARKEQLGGDVVLPWTDQVMAWAEKAFPELERSDAAGIEYFVSGVMQVAPGSGVIVPSVGHALLLMGVQAELRWRGAGGRFTDSDVLGVIDRSSLLGLPTSPVGPDGRLSSEFAAFINYVTDQVLATYHVSVQEGAGSEGGRISFGAVPIADGVPVSLQEERAEGSATRRHAPRDGSGAAGAIPQVAGVVGVAEDDARVVPFAGTVMSAGSGGGVPGVGVALPRVVGVQGLPVHHLGAVVFGGLAGVAAGEGLRVVPVAGGGSRLLDSLGVLARGAVEGVPVSGEAAVSGEAVGSFGEGVRDVVVRALSRDLAHPESERVLWPQVGLGELQGVLEGVPQSEVTVPQGVVGPDRERWAFTALLARPGAWDDSFGLLAPRVAAAALGVRVHGLQVELDGGGRLKSQREFAPLGPEGGRRVYLLRSTVEDGNGGLAGGWWWPAFSVAEDAGRLTELAGRAALDGDLNMLLALEGQGPLTDVEAGRLQGEGVVGVYDALELVTVVLAWRQSERDGLWRSEPLTRVEVEAVVGGRADLRVVPGRQAEPWTPKDLDVVVKWRQVNARLVAAGQGSAAWAEVAGSLSPADASDGSWSADDVGHRIVQARNTGSARHEQSANVSGATPSAPSAPASASVSAVETAGGAAPSRRRRRSRPVRVSGGPAAPQASGASQASGGVGGGAWGVVAWRDAVVLGYGEVFELVSVRGVSSDGLVVVPGSETVVAGVRAAFSQGAAFSPGEVASVVLAAEEVGAANTVGVVSKAHALLLMGVRLALREAGVSDRFTDETVLETIEGAYPLGVPTLEDTPGSGPSLAHAGLSIGHVTDILLASSQPSADTGMQPGLVTADINETFGGVRGSAANPSPGWAGDFEHAGVGSGGLGSGWVSGLDGLHGDPPPRQSEAESASPVGRETEPVSGGFLVGGLPVPVGETSSGAGDQYPDARDDDAMGFVGDGGRDERSTAPVQEQPEIFVGLWPDASGMTNARTSSPASVSPPVAGGQDAGAAGVVLPPVIATDLPDPLTAGGRDTPQTPSDMGADDVSLFGPDPDEETAEVEVSTGDGTAEPGVPAGTGMIDSISVVDLAGLPDAARTAQDTASGAISGIEAIPYGYGDVVMGGWEEQGPGIVGLFGADPDVSGVPDVVRTALVMPYGDDVVMDDWDLGPSSVDGLGAAGFGMSGSGAGGSGGSGYLGLTDDVWAGLLGSGANSVGDASADLSGIDPAGSGRYAVPVSATSLGGWRSALQRQYSDVTAVPDVVLQEVIDLLPVFGLAQQAASQDALDFVGQWLRTGDLSPEINTTDAQPARPQDGPGRSRDGRYPVVDPATRERWADTFTHSHTLLDSLDLARQEELLFQAFTMMSGRHQVPPIIRADATPSSAAGAYLQLHDDMAAAIAATLHTHPRPDLPLAEHPAWQLSETLRTEFATHATTGLPGGTPRAGRPSGTRRERPMGSDDTDGATGSSSGQSTPSTTGRSGAGRRPAPTTSQAADPTINETAAQYPPATTAHTEPTMAQRWQSRLNPAATQFEHHQVPHRNAAEMQAVAGAEDESFETTMDRDAARPRRAGQGPTAESTATPHTRTDTSGDASNPMLLAGTEVRWGNGNGAVEMKIGDVAIRRLPPPRGSSQMSTPIVSAVGSSGVVLRSVSEHGGSGVSSHWQENGYDFYGKQSLPLTARTQSQDTNTCWAFCLGVVLGIPWQKIVAHASQREELYGQKNADTHLLVERLNQLPEWPKLRLPARWYSADWDGDKLQRAFPAAVALEGHWVVVLAVGKSTNRPALVRYWDPYDGLIRTVHLDEFNQFDPEFSVTRSY